MERVLTQILEELKFLNQRVGSMEQVQQQLIQELKADIQKVESKVEKLELRIENEVADKIRGLYDFREVNNDQFTKVIEKLESIEIDTGYLVSRVARLEKMAK
ncbi:MAG: hypothetical protein ACOY35_08270 [Bacillota bacterium]